MRYLVIIVCLLAWPAQAQQTNAQLNTAIGVNFPDNTSFEILPSNLRTITSSIVNSIMPATAVVSGNIACWNGTTGLLEDCGVAPSGNTIIVNTTVVSGGITNGVLFVSSGGTLGSSTAASNAVVITSNTGVPEESTTLPSGIAATNMSLTTPSIAGGSLSGTLSGTPTFSGANFLSLGNLVQSTAGAQFLGVSGASAANYAPITLSALTDIGTPSTTLDYIPIINHSTGTMERTSASELVAAVGGGVTAVTIAGGGGLSLTGTCAITTTGTCTIASNASGWGVANLAADNTCNGWQSQAQCVSSTKTVTISIATPAVITLNSHGYSAGDYVMFSTSGALPTGLATNTLYYVIAAGLTTNTFEVSATLGGSAVNTTGSQSGTQSLAWLSSQKMTVNASYVAFYNPSTGITEKTIVSPTANLQCATNVSGAGGYDATGPFSSTNVVWLYYIWGSSPGVNCVWSTAAPTTGPTLPSTYTSYAPIFPLKFFGAVTLLPVDTSSGFTSYQVRGNHVNLPGRPLFIGAGYPQSAFAYGPWVPNAYALETSFILDAELQASSGGGVIGGMVASTTDNALTTVGSQIFQNISLYPGVASPYWAAQDVPVTIGLQNAPTAQEVWMTASISGGTVANANEDSFLTGYTFSNGQ